MTSKSSFINKTFGNYNLIVQIAKGVSQDTFLALPLNDSEHKVVVKLLKSIRLTSPQERDSFLQEAQFLTQLKHPYILPIVDVGVEKGVPYIVTEYVSGGSLQDRLKRLFSPRLPRAEAISILSQIGQALHYAHERNILHCNIKPENILFNEKNEALLADFGLANLLVTTGSQSRTNLYCAPEQSKGIVSKETDQYALGCIAYRLFSEQGSLAGMAWSKVRRQDIKTARHLPFDLPQYIKAAILKATAQKPDERYANLLAFVNAVNDIAPVSSEYGLPHEYPTLADAVLPISGVGANGLSPLNAEIAFASTENVPAYKNPVKRQTQKKLPVPVKVVGLALSVLIIAVTIFSLMSPFNPMMAMTALMAMKQPTVPFQHQPSNPTHSKGGLTIPRPTATATPTPPAATAAPPTATAIPTATPTTTTTQTFTPTLQANVSFNIPYYVNLTTEGTIYWAQWGYNNPYEFDQKAGGIDPVSLNVFGHTRTYSDYYTAFSWSDGTPTGTANNQSTGFDVEGNGNGFTLTLPASTTPRTLRLYVSVYRAQGQLTASLNGTNLAYQDASLDNRDNLTGGVYTITYGADAAGQTLTLQFVDINNHASDGAVSLQTITVQ